MQIICQDVILGGIDTTVVTAVWTMSELARDTRVMHKLQNEIRNCMGRKERVSEEDISKMTYLKMVVKEALRLHPAAPMLIPHENTTQTQLDGYDILSGTTVLVNGWGIGRDPSSWGENAGEFYPERFENPDVEMGGGNFEFIPFGAGRRACPGKDTSPATVASVVANLLYSFDWKFPEGMKNEDFNMEEEGALIVRKKLPLFLVPIKHNWED